MKTLCPVCSEPAELLAGNRLGKHLDGIGQKCMMTGRTAVPWDERSTRAAVPSRSGNICEFCQKQRAREMHHRVSRGVGGPWCPANILHLCNGCHGDATRNPTWARGMGLIVKSTDGDPGEIPVTREDGTQFQPTNEVTQ
jgi:hypothetical protein